jgi:hypothetical protein
VQQLLQELGSSTLQLAQELRAGEPVEPAPFQPEQLPRISHRQLLEFLQLVQRYLQTTAQQLLQRLPLGEPVLLLLEQLHPEQLSSASMDTMLQLAELFPNVVATSQHEQLQHEFESFQSSVFARELVQEWQAEKRAVAAKYGTEHERVLKRSLTISAFWARVQKHADPSRRQVRQGRWPLLCNLMTAMLVLPHVNADVERLFSALKLVKSRLRTCLLHNTLLQLLRCKVNAKVFGLSSASWSPSPEFLAQVCTQLKAIWAEKNKTQKEKAQAAREAAAAAAVLEQQQQLCWSSSSSRWQQRQG